MADVPTNPSPFASVWNGRETEQLNVRIPVDMITWVHDYAAQNGISVNQAMGRAVDALREQGK